MTDAAGLLLPLACLVWGTMVGVDIVSVPQSMASRPIVVAAVTGLLAAWIEAPAGALGTVLAHSLFIGAVLELYALDVLPVGATKYPDYGPATVAAVYAAWDLESWFGGGVAVGIGLLTALLGGWAMRRLRRANARAMQRKEAAIETGDPRVIDRLHWGGMWRDVGRSAAVTVAGLALASVVWLAPLGGSAVYHWLTGGAVAGGVAAAIGGALRSAGRTRRAAWFTAGLAGGTLLAVLL